MRFKMLLLAFAAGWASASLAAPNAAHGQGTVATTPPPAQQERIEADPAVWVVRDEDTTIYLFGTFHLLDGRRDWFNDEVRTAFDASRELVLEVLIPDNPAALQPLFSRFAIDPQGRTTSSRLPAADWQALQAALTPPVANALDQAHYEPWFFALALTNAASAQLGFSAEFGPETILRNAANGRSMRVSGLETMEFQLGIFDGMSEDSQIRSLRETVAQFQDLGAKLTPMLNAWSSGNVDGLAALLNEEVVRDPEAYRALFTNRNANWARWIRERMARPGTVFVAVGAGHLGGPGSVQEQLTTLGLTATRVPHVARAH